MKKFIVLDLETLLRSGKKWGTGAFLDKNLPFYTKNLEIGAIILTEDNKGERHVHKFVTEAYFVLSGSVRMQIGNDVVRVSKNQVVVIHPKTVHEITDFQPRTQVFLVKAPSRPKDKRIVRN